MLLVFFLPTLVFAGSPSDCRTNVVHTRSDVIDTAFVTTYGSKEEFAHMFCRSAEKQCYRAYDVSDESVGRFSNGADKRALTYVRCTDDNSISYIESYGALARAFNRMKKRHPTHAQSLPIINVQVTETAPAVNFIEPSDSLDSN